MSFVLTAPPKGSASTYPRVVTLAEGEEGDAPMSLLRSQGQQLAFLATVEARSQLRELIPLQYNWDGHYSQKPRYLAISRAHGALFDMFRVASVAGYGWSNPHVSADESGSVVFEWWRGTKKLTLYTSPDDMMYVKVWGPSIDTDMADGPVERSDYDFVPLWAWLHT